MHSYLRGRRNGSGKGLQSTNGELHGWGLKVGRYDYDFFDFYFLPLRTNKCGV